MSYLMHYGSIIKHKWFVALYMMQMIAHLFYRLVVHDWSKFTNAEAKYFVKTLPRLKSSVYNSDEYKALLDELKPALQHHYKLNSHHPEHTLGGIAGMNLLDLVEMYCDWKAAGRRHVTGNILASIYSNKNRFHIQSQLAQILVNTASTKEAQKYYDSISAGNPEK